jgi:hypothetical protein
VPNSKVAIDTVPLSERVVRVSIPAKVTFQLGDMQKITASVLGRLGCPTCHSGWDIRFDLIRSFVADEKFNLRESMSGGVIIDG